MSSSRSVAAARARRAPETSQSSLKPQMAQQRQPMQQQQMQQQQMQQQQMMNRMPGMIFNVNVRC